MTLSPDTIATYRTAISMADDGGTIQAAVMVELVADPTMHTVCTLRDVRRYLLLLDGIDATEQANEDGDTYGDLLAQVGY